MHALTKALAPYDAQVKQNNDVLPSGPFNSALVGKKGCGKSNLILNLIGKKESPLFKRFDMIFLISPTAIKDPKMDELVEDIGPDQFYQELNNDVLDEIMEKIEGRLELAKKKKKKNLPEFLIIYDDCIHFLKGKNSRGVDRLVSQNRHSRLSNCFLLQKWNSFMPTLVRSNLDAIMFFRTDNKKELASFIDEVGGDEDEMKALYEYATDEPYSFLYVNMYNGKPRYYKKFDEIKFQKK